MQQTIYTVFMKNSDFGQSIGVFNSLEEAKKNFQSMLEKYLKEQEDYIPFHIRENLLKLQETNYIHDEGMLITLETQPVLEENEDFSTNICHFYFNDSFEGEDYYFNLFLNESTIGNTIDL